MVTLFDVGEACIFNGIEAQVVRVDGSFRVIEWGMPDGSKSDYEAPVSWLGPLLTDDQWARLSRLTVSFYYGHGVGEGIQEIDDHLVEKGLATLTATPDSDPLYEYCPHLVSISEVGRKALEWKAAQP